MKELGNAILGDTPEARKQFRKGIVNLINTQGQANNSSGQEGEGELSTDTAATTSGTTSFEQTADAFVNYRRSIAPDRILDWRKFNLIKAKKEMEGH